MQKSNRGESNQIKSQLEKRITSECNVGASPVLMERGSLKKSQMLDRIKGVVLSGQDPTQ